MFQADSTKKKKVLDALELRLINKLFNWDNLTFKTIFGVFEINIQDIYCFT